MIPKVTLRLQEHFSIWLENFVGYNQYLSLYSHDTAGRTRPWCVYFGCTHMILQGVPGLALCILGVLTWYCRAYQALVCVFWVYSHDTAGRTRSWYVYLGCTHMILQGVPGLGMCILGVLTWYCRAYQALVCVLWVYSHDTAGRTRPWYVYFGCTHMILQGVPGLGVCFWVYSHDTAGHTRPWYVYFGYTHMILQGVPGLGMCILAILTWYCRAYQALVCVFWLYSHDTAGHTRPWYVYFGCTHMILQDIPGLGMCIWVVLTWYCRMYQALVCVFWLYSHDTAGCTRPWCVYFGCTHMILKGIPGLGMCIWVYSHDTAGHTRPCYVHFGYTHMILQGIPGLGVCIWGVLTWYCRAYQALVCVFGVYSHDTAGRTRLWCVYFGCTHTILQGIPGLGVCIWSVLTWYCRAYQALVCVFWVYSHDTAGHTRPWCVYFGCTHMILQCVPGLSMHISGVLTWYCRAYQALVCIFWVYSHDTAGCTRP